MGFHRVDCARLWQFPCEDDIPSVCQTCVSYHFKQSSSAIVVSVEREAGIVFRWLDDTGEKERSCSASCVSVPVDANEIRFRCQRALINLEVIPQVRCVKVGGSEVAEAGKPLVEQSPTNCTTLFINRCLSSSRIMNETLLMVSV